MENENEEEFQEGAFGTQDDAQEGEEGFTDTSTVDEGEETVSIPKSKFTKMQRKAQAYDAAKSRPTQKAPIINRSNDAVWKTRMELKVDGYNDAEVDFILKNGGKKALEVPYVKTAIDVMREQTRAEIATADDVSSKSDPSKRPITPAELSKLTSAEQMKVLSEIK